MFIKCWKTVQVKFQLDNEGVFLSLNRVFPPKMAPCVALKLNQST